MIPRRLLLWVLPGVLVAGCFQEQGGNGKKPIAVLSAVSPSVPVQTNVGLNGVDSYDPDNAAPGPPHGIASFVWVLNSVPVGSTSAIISFGSTATFTADLPGEYSGDLVVVDEDGLHSNPAEFSVVATGTPVPTPPPFITGIRATLSWESDQRDVDLHLVDMTAGGVFYSAPYDCFFANLAPNWGDPSSAADDPVLSGDSPDGPGPEVINLLLPEGGHVYMVYADYYNDEGFGPSNPHVLIQTTGPSGVSQDSTISLSTSGKVWTVGSVSWPSGAFTPDNTIFDH